MDEPFLMDHAKDIKHFHIHDGIGRQHHRALGSGEIPLEAKLSLAGKLGCRCVVETKTSQALRASIAWLDAGRSGKTVQPDSLL